MSNEARSVNSNWWSYCLGVLGLIIATDIIMSFLSTALPEYAAILVMVSGFLVATALYYRLRRINLLRVGWVFFAIGWLAVASLFAGAVYNKQSGTNSQLWSWLGIALGLLDLVLIGSVYRYR